MSTFGLIILSTIGISFISLIGVFFIGMKGSATEKFLERFVSFAVGGLLGGAFFHLLPESIELKDSLIFTYVLSGIIIFFVIEKFLHWRHCHKDKCDVHTFTYLNLIGDGVHNFLDGIIIATSFMTDTHLGMATTIAVAAHEIPQEVGDFGILIYGGFSKAKALLYNFLSALTSVAGAIIAYLFFGQILWLKIFLIPCIAGGFIYIALADLIPELHKERESSKIPVQLVTMFSGLGLMWGLKIFFER
ncbi:MAG: ZIP family metal transporter [Nitrospirae bacterium]|nr:ZIP family metal transporter [Nitrospirota bacterium]